MPPSTLGTIRKNRGMNQRELAAAIGCDPSFVYRSIDTSQIPKNHPLVPKLAQVLGLSVADTQVLCRAPDYNEFQLKMALARLGKPGPRGKRGKYTVRKGKAETWGQRAARKRREARAGTSIVHVARKVPARLNGGKPAFKRAYNALRLMDPEARQFARSLATMTSLAAIKGTSKFIEGTAIPWRGMAVMLNDYFRLKGVPESVVAAVDYDEVFG